MHTSSGLTDTELVRARRRAHAVAARTGVDFRTAMRAVLLGPQAIRPLRIREEIRTALAEVAA